MGVFRALNKSISSVTRDIWKDYFYCESLNNNVLLARGIRRNATENNKGDANIISNGSTVIVNEGQAILIVRNGEVVDICNKAGVYTYEYDEQSDIPVKRATEGFKGFISDLTTRFSYAGETVEDHRVYYINTKDIVGNIFGTINPIPFRVVDYNIGLDIDISIRCNGEFSFQIVNPALFYRNISGNVQTEYRREEIESRLKTELLNALHPAIGQLSEMGVRYNQLAQYTTNLVDIMDNTLDALWGNTMGISLTSIAFGTIKADAEDEDTIKELQKVAVFRNPNMAAANLVSSQAEAMKLAASNQSAGPMMALASMNAMMNTQSPAMSLMYQMQQNMPQPQQQIQPRDSWKCQCGNFANGNFCNMCGNKKLEGRTCPNCGTSFPYSLPIKFCSNCGASI